MNLICPKCNRPVEEDFVSCSCGYRLDTTLDIHKTPRVTKKASFGSNGPIIDVTPEECTIPVLATPQVDSRPSSSEIPLNSLVRAVHEPFHVMVITIADDAKVLVPFTPVDQITNIPKMRPGGNTNIRAGLSLAGEELSKMSFRQKVVISLTDGVANRGGGVFGDHTEAAHQEAKKLVAAGSKLGAVGCGENSGTFNLESLKKIASVPSLVGMASVSTLVDTIRKTTVRATQSASASGGQRCVVFIVDTSYSMVEDGKMDEARRALESAIEYLRGIS
jgi:Mg-chelatase subunit ChlD